MNPLPQYPTLSEWLAAIQANPELAARHADFLRLQASMYGVGAPPAVLLSIQDYEQALAQHAAAPASPGATAPGAAAAQSLLHPYPDERQWAALIAADAGAARQQLADLKLQAIRIGALSVPFNLHASIAAYDAALAANQPPAAEPAGLDERKAEATPEKQPWWRRLLDL